MLVWLRLQDSAGLELELVRVIVPVKPLRAVTVIVEFAVEPRLALTTDGLALREKSGPTATWTLT
jgi:hypothetical protein